MARRLSADDRASFSIGLIAAAILALLFVTPYLHLPDPQLPDIFNPLWGNIYLSSQRTGDGILMILAFIGVSTAFGTPKHLFASRLIFMAGLASIILAVSNLARFVPHYSLYDSLVVGGAGFGIAKLLLGGAPSQVWRSLIAPGADYAGRLMPLAAGIACVALLGFWSWLIYGRLNAHDHSAGCDIASFVLGIACTLVGGKRHPTVPQVDVVQT